MTSLENRVKRLETENMQLRVQLRVGRETDATETAEKWRITNLLGDMIKENKSDDVIAETIQMFTERYADYGKERRVACRYHLDYLEKLLVPTQVRNLEFGVWSLEFEVVGCNVWSGVAFDVVSCCCVRNIDFCFCFGFCFVFFFFAIYSRSLKWGCGHWTKKMNFMKRMDLPPPWTIKIKIQFGTYCAIN